MTQNALCETITFTIIYTPPGEPILDADKKTDYYYQEKMIITLNTDIKYRINKALSFIEENLLEPISISDVASHIYYSPYHFQRLFKESTGFSLKKYIRKRRLSMAAYDLVRLNKQIIDTAYDYNFGYEQSFIRAFKEEFGITPGKFRKQKKNLVVTDRIYLADTVIKPGLMLHHASEHIGLRYKVAMDRDIAFRLKSDFLKNYSKSIKNNSSLLYCFSNYDDTYFNFFASYIVDNLKSCNSKLEKITIDPHFSYFYYNYCDKSIHTLNLEDLQPGYWNLHRKYFSNKKDITKAPFSYTVVDTNGLTNSGNFYSIHAPIILN